jgi:hypothetical protein
MFEGIKSIFSPSKLIDTVSAGVDKMVYTTEEKADFFGVMMKLYAPFKKAQRYLATIFCVPYALAFFVTFCVSFFTNVNTQILMLKGDIAVIVGLVVSFYFGGGFVEGVIGKATEKKQAEK